MRHWKQVAVFALVVTTTAVVPTSLEAQTGKIGVINTSQVLGTSAAGVAAGDEFGAYATERQQPLLDLQTEIDVKTQQLQDQQRALSQTALATRTAELDRLQRQFNRDQEDLAVDLEAKNAEVLEPVYELANAVIDEFATEQGYDIIIDPTAAQGLLVYMGPALDVSAEIIRRMDARYTAGASAPPPTPATAPAAGTPQ